MDEAMKGTIETLVAKVETKARELAELKRTINFLSREAGGEPVYPDESGGFESVGAAGIRPDQYYGKSPITAAREYLESRGRAVPVAEIMAALERGGFNFDAQGWKKQDRLRALAISLGKNTAVFHKLPNGTVGLVKFYPDIQAGRKRRTAAAAEEFAEEAESEAPMDDEESQVEAQKK